MQSALDQLTDIPAADVAALRKMWSGALPDAQPLGTHPAVLVVDMTEGFVRDEYPTGWSATGEPCVSALRPLLVAARAVGAPVIYTVSTPLSHRAEVGAWLRGRPGPSMFPFDRDGRHHEIVGELTPLECDIVYAKPKPSAFFGTQLHAILNSLRVDTLIVTGMTTSGCVRATVNDAFMTNYHVVVPIECVADRSQLSHQIELFDMGSKYADVVNVHDVLAELNARAEERQRASSHEIDSSEPEVPA